MSCDRKADVISFNDTPVFSYACLRAQRVLFYSSLQACCLHKLDGVTLHCVCVCVCPSLALNQSLFKDDDFGENIKCAF